MAVERRNKQSDRSRLPSYIALELCFTSRPAITSPAVAGHGLKRAPGYDDTVVLLIDT